MSWRKPKLVGISRARKGGEVRSLWEQEKAKEWHEEEDKEEVLLPLLVVGGSLRAAAISFCLFANGFRTGSLMRSLGVVWRGQRLRGPNFESSFHRKLKCTKC